MQDRSLRDRRGRGWWVFLAAVLTLAGAALSRSDREGIATRTRSASRTPSRLPRRCSASRCATTTNIPRSATPPTRPTDPSRCSRLVFESGDAEASLTRAARLSRLTARRARDRSGFAGARVLANELAGRRIRPCGTACNLLQRRRLRCVGARGPIEIASMDPKLGAVYYLSR